MRFRVLAALLLSLSSAAAEPPKGMIYGTWKEGKYLLYVPESYQAADGRRWGLWVTMIPGDHEAKDYEDTWKGPAGDRAFLSLVVEFGVPGDQVAPLMEKISADYGLSPNKQWMTGYAEGAPRAWEFALAHPEKLCALTIFQGFPPAQVTAAAKGVPVAIVHDVGCSYVPVADARALAKKLEGLGYEVRYQEMRRAESHDDWPDEQMAPTVEWAMAKAAGRGAAFLKMAGEHLDAGHPGRALAALEEMNTQQVGGEFTREMEALSARIDTLLAEALKKAADAAAAGDYDAAATQMLAVTADFKGTFKESGVASRMNKLQKDPKFKAALDGIARRQAEAAAVAAAEAAQQLEEGKRWLEAIAAWKKVAADHPGTETGKEAAAHAEKMEKDPEIRKQLADARSAGACRKLMQLGDSFAKNKMPEKAIAKYQEIVDKYPETSFAAEAKKKIEALK